MEDHDVASRCTPEIGEHVVECNGASLGVEIAKIFDRHPRRREDRSMVAVGGRADPHAGGRRCVLDQFGGNAQGARAAGGLDRADGTTVLAVAQQQALGKGDECLFSRDRQVGLAAFRRDERLLGGLDGGEHRRPPFLVLIDAHDEVQLAPGTVRAELLVNGHDGVQHHAARRAENRVHRVLHVRPGERVPRTPREASGSSRPVELAFDAG